MLQIYGQEFWILTIFLNRFLLPKQNGCMIKYIYLLVL